MSRLLWLIPISLLLLGAGCTVSVWNECRETNSWLYCMYVLGGR